MKTALAQEKAPQLRIVAGGNAPDPNEIRILVIDGHVLFVEGIRTLIRSESGMTIIGHAAHRTAALEAAAMKPHVILLELVLQDQSTLDFLPDLLRIAEGARVLVVTETTVRHYLTTIFDKLAVADRLELIIYAYQHGLARI